MSFRMLMIVAGVASLAAPTALAKSLVVPMAMATPHGPGGPVGKVILRDGRKGVSIHLDLQGLPAGEHGFHLHANPSCAAAAAADGVMTPAGAAGAHFDPGMTKAHAGPEGAGHLGDLPRITVAGDGTSRQTLTATRITSVKAFRGHALMIHAGGDTYSDTPPLGGGGARLACGVVP